MSRRTAARETAPSEGSADSRLEAEIANAGRARRLSAEAAFRASVEQRLRNLESDLGEVRTRLNGLLFFLAGTVIAQALLRLLA